MALQQFKAAAARRGLLQGAQAPALSFVGGAFAGAAATVASYPFDLLRTTLAAQGEPRVRPRCPRAEWCTRSVLGRWVLSPRPWRRCFAGRLFWAQGEPSVRTDLPAWRISAKHGMRLPRGCSEA